MKKVSKSGLEWIFLFSFTVFFIVLLILPQDKSLSYNNDTEKCVSTIEKSGVITNCLDVASNPNEIELSESENY